MPILIRKVVIPMCDTNQENVSQDIPLKDVHLLLQDNPLTEEDFYPPPDERYLKSGVEDIRDGDCFEEYITYFFQEYGEEMFDEI